MIFQFELDIQKYHDRGGIHCQQRYAVHVEDGAKDGWFSEFLEKFDRALSTIPHYEITGQQAWWFDELGSLRGDWLASDIYNGDGIRTLDSDINAAVQTVLKDFISSDDWVDWFNGEGENDYNLIDFDAAFNPPAPAPLSIPVGTEVYTSAGKVAIYRGLTPNGYWEKDGEVMGNPDFFIPTASIDMKKLSAEVEAFPAPNADYKRGLKWFARMKKSRKFEHFARTKKEAVQAVVVDALFHNAL